MQNDCFYRFKGSPQFKTLISDAVQWAVSRPAERAQQQLAALSVSGPVHGRNTNTAAIAQDGSILGSIQEAGESAASHSPAVRAPESGQSGDVSRSVQSRFPSS